MSKWFFCYKFFWQKNFNINLTTFCIFRYRKLSGKEGKLEGEAPAFGINMGLRLPGIVKVGDPVFVGIVY